MRTYLGRSAPLPVNNFEPHVVDMVMHLGRIRRFGGWGNPEWTVLHHSMLCSLIWMRWLGNPTGVHHALMHDLHEYTLGDVVNPVKNANPELKAGMKAAEVAMDERYRRYFKTLPPDEAEAVGIKVVDFAALCIEGHYFGTPNVLFDVIRLDIPKLTPQVLRLVQDAIVATAPEVYEAMFDLGYLPVPEEAV